MTAPAAFRATIHGLRTVPSRKVLQIVIEAPIEQQAEIARIAEHGAWVAVARLATNGKEDAAPKMQSTDEETPRPLPQPAGGAKRAFHDLSPAQQAGILCNEPAFAAYLRETEPDAWSGSNGDIAACVRLLLGVTSRADIDKDHRRRVLWQNYVNGYRAWQVAPQVGA